MTENNTIFETLFHNFGKRNSMKGSITNFQFCISYSVVNLINIFQTEACQ